MAAAQGTGRQTWAGALEEFDLRGVGPAVPCAPLWPALSNVAPAVPQEEAFHRSSRMAAPTAGRGARWPAVFDRTFAARHNPCCAGRETCAIEAAARYPGDTCRPGAPGSFP